MEFFGTPDVGKMRAARDVTGLIRALRYKKDPYVRQAAAEALGQLFEKRAVEPLLVLLDDPKGRVRKAAVDALGEIGDTRAVAPLLATLHYTWEHVGVRIGTVKALEKLGDERAIDPLTALLTDRTDAIRVAAVEALGHIVRQPEKRNLMFSERVESLCSELPGNKKYAMRKKTMIQPIFALLRLMKSKTVSVAIHLMNDRGKALFSGERSYATQGDNTGNNITVELSYTAWLLPR